MYGGSGALENFFEKSTQPEVYLIFFGLSVEFLFVKWQLREAVGIICEREVMQRMVTRSPKSQIRRSFVNFTEEILKILARKRITLQRNAICEKRNILVEK